MRIEPCKDDIKTILFYELPIILVSLVMCCYLKEWDLFFIVMCSVTYIILSLIEIPDIIYLGRYFVLDAEGWTISIGKYQKT